MQQKTSIRVTLVSHFGPCGWKGLHFFTALLATTHEAVVGIGFQGINNDDWKMLIDNWFQSLKLVENRIDIVCIEQCSFFKNSNSDKEKFARIYALLMKLPQVKVVNHAKYEPLMIKVQMFAELEGTPRIGKDNQNDSENNDDIREER